MESDEKKIGKILSNFIGRKERETTRTDCPNEETLGGYLSGILTGETRDAVEVHLADCSSCLDSLIAAFKAAEDNEIGAVPQWLINRAKDLLPRASEGRIIFDLVLRLSRDALDLVSTSGRPVLSAVPSPVRGQAKSADSPIIRVEEEIGGLKIGIEAELVEAGLCEIMVQVTEGEAKPAEGVRVSLESKGREQASFMTRHGRAVFDRIPRGEYNLRISSPAASLGSIHLSIEEGP